MWLNRELAKGTEGNPLVIDNAEMMKAQSIVNVRDTVDSSRWGEEEYVSAKARRGAASGKRSPV